MRSLTTRDVISAVIIAGIIWFINATLSDERKKKRK